MLHILMRLGDLTRVDTTTMSPGQSETAIFPHVEAMKAPSIGFRQEIADQVPFSSLISSKLIAGVLYFGLPSPPSRSLKTTAICDTQVDRHE